MDRWVSCRGAQQCLPVAGEKSWFWSTSSLREGYSTVTAGSHHRYTRGMAACDGAQASGMQVRSGRCRPCCTWHNSPL